MEQELRSLIDAISPIDSNIFQKAKEHTAQLVMPPRALGRLHEISERICAIQRTLNPDVSQKQVIVFAGDHGIVEEGVSAFPQVVTLEMVRCFVKGGAGISVISRFVGAEVMVVDMGIIPDFIPENQEEAAIFKENKVARGTKNFAKGPAMTRNQALQSILNGFNIAQEAISKGINIIATGDMGIGNTTPSSAIGCVYTGESAEVMVGPGTGIDQEGIKKKIAAVKKGLDVNKPDPKDPIEVLSKVGGFEIGGIAGCILACAYHKIPVMIDGFISTAGALIAKALCPSSVEYMFAGHKSEEPGHIAMLKYLGLTPLLDLGMRLGEGTGGALAMNIVDAACHVFNEVMTFDQAGVHEKEN
ncbi:nicotinate-nucleotide--dimethylbenzimidazole phosphoribosyltransferase [Desulfothermus naphthae]